jgi:uncharacterized membrane protein
VIAHLRPHRLVLAVAGALLLVTGAAPVRAAEPAGVDLTGGCTIGLTSLDAGGGVIDTATGPAVADKGNPLDITLDGSVAWQGTAPLMTSGTYQVALNGVPVPGYGGSFTNTDKKTSASGTADVGSFVGALSFLQQFIAVTMSVSGTVTAPEGGCTGQTWVRIGKAEPLFSGGAILGLALAALGVLGLFKSIRGRHALRGLAAGLILGIALVLLVLTFGVYLAGPLTPWVAIGGTTVLGFVLGLIDVG